MSRCACSFIKKINACIMGSLRMILFFGTLFLLCATLANLLAVNSRAPREIFNQLPRMPSRATSHIISATSILSAIAGLYGSFYSHRAGLKMFSILAAVSGLLWVASTMHSISSETIQRDVGLYMKSMQVLQPYYSWDGPLPPATSEPLERVSTAAWDKLQATSGCCGIEGPQDWARSRPPHLPDRLFPSSCCAFESPETKLKQAYVGPLCVKGPEFYEIGCLERQQQLEKALLLFSCFLAALHFMLAFLACCLGQHIEQEEAPPTAFPPSIRFWCGQLDGMGKVKEQQVNCAHAGPDQMTTDYYNSQMDPPPRYGSFE